MQYNITPRPQNVARSYIAHPWRLSLLVGIVVVIGLLISACGSSASPNTSQPAAAPNLGTPGEYTCLQDSITATGSPTMSSLVQAVAKEYEARCSGAHITVKAVDSTTSLSQLESNTIQISDSDIFRLPDQNDLFDHQIAVVVFALAINPQVTGVTNLTSTQLKGIYTGAITNWHQVGGPNLPIVLVSRPATSDVRAIFQQEVLDRTETRTGPANLVSDTNSTVVQNITQTPGAIGYIPTSAVRQAGVKIITINGHASTVDQVKNNTYPFWTIEHMYTRGPGSGLAQALIDFMQSSEGQQVTFKLNLIPLNEMSMTAIQARQPTNLSD